MSNLPRVLALTILLGVAAQSGIARAGDARVPEIGSAQGEIVPDALPGGGPPHARVNEGHLAAPSGQTPVVGSAQGQEWGCPGSDTAGEVVRRGLAGP